MYILLQKGKNNPYHVTGQKTVAIDEGISPIWWIGRPRKFNDRWTETWILQPWKDFLIFFDFWPSYKWLKNDPYRVPLFLIQYFCKKRPDIEIQSEALLAHFSHSWYVGSKSKEQIMLIFQNWEAVSRHYMKRWHIKICFFPSYVCIHLGRKKSILSSS